MKVKDLIKELEKCDPERRIILTCEDEDITRSNHLLETFAIDTVSEQRVVIVNHDVGDRGIQFDSMHPDAQDIVIISLDFKF